MRCSFHWRNNNTNNQDHHLDYFESSESAIQQNGISTTLIFTHKRFANLQIHCVHQNGVTQYANCIMANGCSSNGQIRSFFFYCFATRHGNELKNEFNHINAIKLRSIWSIPFMCITHQRRIRCSNLSTLQCIFGKWLFAEHKGDNRFSLRIFYGSKRIITRTNEYHTTHTRNGNGFG